MSAVDNANQRLDAALSRLESALQAYLAARDDTHAAAAERARLEQELAAARTQFANLRQTSTAVSQRLDTAIGTLKNILAD